MTNPPTLTDYMPATDQVPLALIVSTRQQLVNYLSQWWPQVDTRPGSVFGDLVITPCAVLIAASVVAEQNMFADLQLSNVANGNVNNTEFVTTYLANFGVSAQNGASSTGSMALVFSVNQTYVFSASTVFTFGVSAFQVSPAAGNPVIVYPVGSTVGSYVLTPNGNGQFVVYIPVTGSSGAIVTDGTAATTNLAQTQLVSVTAAGDFNSGTAPATLSQLAVQAMRMYPAASLTSRRGALSFITQNWPNLLSTAVTVTGDTEMIRASQNPLGINQSALDIFLRSQTAYSSGNMMAALTYNADLQGWVGGLPFPSPPAFFSTTTGVFQANNFLTSPGKSVVYGRSLNPKINSVGVAFSQDEQFGILLVDQVPTSFRNAFATLPKATASANISLIVEGEYWGNIFQMLPGRTITIRFDAITQVQGLLAVQCSVLDSANNDTVTVYFVPDSSPTPLTGIILQTDAGYQKMFNGLNLIATVNGGPWDPALAIGAQFTFSFQGKVANFSVDYLYEPMIPVVAAAITASDNVSVNTSVLAKSFVPCDIVTFVVNYRVKRGTVVNITAAQTAIFNYVNSIGYPDAYEESQIGAIMMANGATGVSSVTKVGMIYPSLAGIYLDQDQNQTNIAPVITQNLSVPSSDLGFGPKNVTYILPMAVIQFNESVY